MNTNIKGTLRICFNTDFDFGFDNYFTTYKDWNIDCNDCYYTFKLNFEGSEYDLKNKILDIFEIVSTRKIYIMQSLCNAFEQLENNCSFENMKEDVYIDMGNQYINASFNFESLDESINLKLKIKEMENNLKARELSLQVEQENIENYKKDIEKLKEELNNTI